MERKLPSLDVATARSEGTHVAHLIRVQKKGLVQRDDTTHTGHSPTIGERSACVGASAYLIVLTGSAIGEMHKLDSPTTVVGRGEDSTIRLTEDGVSRRHAAIVVKDGRVLLEDLGSSNGTYRNGSRITEAVLLRDGDKISMGGTTILKFTYQDDLDQRFQRGLYESVVRDGLTKVFNRRYFDDHLRLELAFAARHATPLALILIDVDHFKRINDQHGHPTGDRVLRMLGKRLSSGIRSEDIIARYGGEEFALICRQTDASQAFTLAERLRRLVAEQPFAQEGLFLPVTVSIGVAAMPADGVARDADIVKRSDGALYEAKRRGRNCTFVSSELAP